MKDLIERQAAINLIDHYIKIDWDAWKRHSSTFIEGMKDGYCRIRSEILSLPSAQPNIPTVDTEDLIVRGDAIEAVNKRIEQIGYDNDPYVLSIRQAVRDVPSAQPETAKRIVGKSRNGMTLWYQCDMCNEPVDAQDDFCRGCGRRLTDG